MLARLGDEELYLLVVEHMLHQKHDFVDHLAKVNLLIRGLLDPREREQALNNLGDSVQLTLNLADFLPGAGLSHFSVEQLHVVEANTDGVIDLVGDAGGELRD